LLNVSSKSHRDDGGDPGNPREARNDNPCESTNGLCSERCRKNSDGERCSDERDEPCTVKEWQVCQRSAVRDSVGNHPPVIHSDAQREGHHRAKSYGILVTQRKSNGADIVRSERRAYQLQFRFRDPFPLFRDSTRVRGLDLEFVVFYSLKTNARRRLSRRQRGFIRVRLDWNR
jgi:hypothetical protein